MGARPAAGGTRAGSGPPPAVCDMHVHTHHSCDSDATMESYCMKARAEGVSTVCFTDHVDYNPADSGYGFYRPVAYFDEFNRVRDKYAGSVTLLAGLEFAEPHAYRAEFEELLKLPYDFVIGSVHYWYRDMFPSEMIKLNIPIEASCREYWKKIRDAVSYGGFDSLGHIDFPKRYFGRMPYDDGLIEEAFAAMVRNGICLEINTSSLRKGLDETMPGRLLLERYAASGGCRVTLGADAHSPDDLAAGHADAARLAGECGLSVVFFKERQPLIISQIFDSELPTLPY